MKRRIFYDAGAGSGGGGAKTEQELLLEKIKGTVQGELQTRNFQTKEAVEQLIMKTMEGISLEALRTFDADKTKETVKNLAGEFEKLKQRGFGSERREQLNAIRAAFENEKFMEKLEKVFNSRDPKIEIRLNTRAAVNMTIANAVDDGNIPEDILNSFSVDNFVKKRQGVEYVFEVISRKTVQNITEYKTWMEEGDEEGAFAIVVEGATKPLVSKTLVRNTSKAKKIAGKRVYTEEFSKFRKEAWGIVEDLFNDQMVRNYAAGLVTDLDAVAVAYTGTTLDDTIANPNNYHAIGAVAAQIETLNFVPDLLILHPQDKWAIHLLQTSGSGEFFTAVPVMGADGSVNIMGFRTITSTKMTLGSFGLGEAKLYKTEEEPVQIRIGYGIDVTKTGENVTDVTSDFDNNRFRIITEMFYHSYIATNHLGSYVKAAFTTVKAALATP